MSWPSMPPPRFQVATLLSPPPLLLNGLSSLSDTAAGSIEKSTVPVGAGPVFVGETVAVIVGSCPYGIPPPVLTVTLGVASCTVFCPPPPGLPLGQGMYPSQSTAYIG